MNRAFAIILIPAGLVGDWIRGGVSRMGVAPAYWRLILTVLLILGGVVWWLGRRRVRKAGSGA